MNDIAENKELTRRERLRERLIDAAEAAIRANGLSGLKARDVAKTAGCALGAIYTAFDDLDELILSVNARTLARLEAALARGDRSHDALQRLALVYLNFASREEPSWRALFEHRMPAQKPLPNWYAKERDRLFDLLEEPLGQFLPHEPKEALRQRARTLFSAVHGVVLLGLDEKLADTTRNALETELAALIELIETGLKASARR